MTVVPVLIPDLFANSGLIYNTTHRFNAGLIYYTLIPD